MTTYKTLAFAIALFAVCTPLHALDIRIGNTPAARIAKDAAIPGKGVAGQCLPFATALHEKFEAAGIPSEVIVYGYESSAAPGVATVSSNSIGSRGAHAVVVYQDHGRTYMMDNQSWTPQWIHNAAPVQMAQQFSGITASVRIARVLNDELPKTVAPCLDGTRIAGR